MSKIETNKKYNSQQITELDNNEWTSFENLPGSEVELFLKDKLEDSVVSFKYHPTDYKTENGTVLNNVLVGLNAFGKEVCYEQVINANPTYTVDFAFKAITVGATPYPGGNNSNIQVNKSDNLTVSATFKFILTGNLAGNDYNETSSQSITFKWFKDQYGVDVDATLDTLTRTISPGENITVNIDKMFEYPFSGRYLGIVFNVPNGETETYIFDQSFTLRKLELSYNGNLVIGGDTDECIITNINLNGSDNDDLSTYKLQYYLDNTVAQEKNITESMTVNNIQLNLPNLTEGAHDLFIRVKNSSGSLVSNYIQISFIFQKTRNSVLTNAIAMVSEVPDKINNCNLSKFFKVITTANISGDIHIIALKSSSLSNISGINTIEDAKLDKNKNFVFKEVNLSLLNTDKSQQIDYTSYIEIPGNNDTQEYLKILVKDGSGTRTLNYYQLFNNTATKASYKRVSIINPKEGSQHLQYTVGEILGFSQIKNGNVFEDLSDNLDDSDGLQLENIVDNTESITMTTFKVSPTEGVFKSPKKLLSAGKTPLHQGKFSIELMFKTYGISDLEDKILTIGNITLCPKHIFVNHEPDKTSEPHHTINASRADFRKEVLQHIMITYDPEYKPSTYDILYDKFFTVGSTTYTESAKTYPCLKFYVNGTINRIISISPSTICSEGDFNFQIHPTNSNINMYIFRTYDKCLNYEEVRKNYTSSMSKLVDKQAYYLDNDILYLNTDFAANQIASKTNILNTISLGKCINKFNSVSNPNRLYTDRKVLLIALPNGVLPPYYGNRKNDEPFATILVHYPNDTKHSGRLAPQDLNPSKPKGTIKAQGSSAKKYMIHNTSYSKFNFTPESEFTSESPKSYTYYQMPGSDIKIKKLVGKVNYASSMQSHKEGACKLFHEAYVSPQFGFNTSWMNGGRKAVLEDEFLYFFVNVPLEDLQTITWDYFKQKDGTYNFENCYFLGFQTWGSAKGDEPTSGYSDATPHYLMLEGADNDNPVANFKTPWASMQIWGNYRGGNEWANANSTIINTLTSNPTPNLNYYHQFAGHTNSLENGFYTPDYLTGLLIKDETIVFDPGTEKDTSSDKKADALDVDFGCTEGDGYVEKGKWYLDGEEVNEGTPGAEKAVKDNLFFVFEDKVIESVNRFATFYNLVYTFDFSSLLYIPSGKEIDGYSLEINDKTSYQYKLVFGRDCTIKYGDTIVTPAAGDIYRWEKAWGADIISDSKAKWVPAGLYHNSENWESLNISNICTWYSNAVLGREGFYPKEYAFFKNYSDLIAKTSDQQYKHIFSDGCQFTGDEDTAEDELKAIRACMAEAFKIIIYEFVDVDDMSYHQAFIKLVAGTDNRAKNTYFQIVGPIYTDKYTTLAGEEVGLVKVTEGDYKGKVGYIKDNQFFEVIIDKENVTETENIFTFEELETKSVYYKNTGNGDYKIRFYADDLDTIFKTDNNGQQVKPYYLLEPPFNKNMEELWGDMHSGLFYNFDLLFIEKVKSHLANLLIFATGGDQPTWPDTHTTKFYDYFFRIQKSLPAISYNHQSEIYYESAQTLWQDGGGTDFYDSFVKSGISSWADFNNNKVYDPVSLSHGSCLEAEIEYLRDRVLLLSTYVNRAKNYTDTSILLNGGSAVTSGSQINIQTEYTSFIQYIYPIINNIASSKDNTTLQYDHILDYINWDNSNYNYIKDPLVYNIALPNEETTLSVNFTSSSLTNNSYWTSTDLYRTINIKSGTNAFSQMFKFPNASTVISQDPSYKIEISENKELKVVEYLESIEHLVLQNANISSIGLNFTGCNRLKTLVLGKTEDNLTDSPEDTPAENIEWHAVKFVDVLDASKQIKLNAAEASTGFQQLILPKSNSVEQVILPNCIKVININHYPKLKRFEFNTGTQLVNLTIDGRNPNDIIEYILSNFVGQYTTTLEITNIPENFWLTESTCRKLVQIENVKMIGTVNIGDGVNKASIDWSTKKLLVEKFGNIETSNLKFEYNKINPSGKSSSVNATGIIESSGVAPVILTMEWNNVLIDSDNKHVKIHYMLMDKDTDTTPNTEDIKLLDKWTPNLIIKEGLKGVYRLITRVYTSTSAYKDHTTEITVGFYAPKPGDFAYANGSFSKVCDPSLGIVGIVFYSYKTEDRANNQNVYDVRVLSADYSSTQEPLGPASYAINWDNNLRKGYQTNYSGLLSSLSLNPSNYFIDITDERKSTANGTIVYNSTWTNSSTPLHQASLPNISELTYQKGYINRVNAYLGKLSNINGLTNYIDEDSVLTKDGKERFESALNILKSIPNINVGNESYGVTACNGFHYALYPAFLKALYYEPNLSLSGKGEDYFGLGNWYIPDSREMERLIYYRINSTITNAISTEHHWNSTDISNTDVSGQGYNIFNQDAFDNIKFLERSSTSYITSEGNNEGEGLTYHDQGTWYGDLEPNWYQECVEDYNNLCARDIAHNISPVCRIVLTEKL